MKKLIIFAVSFVLLLTTSYAQKYITKNGHIKFFSSAPLEDIEANNYQVNAALDLETGDMVFKVLIKAFEFDKALMQEHFNENYMESDKYPNSVFKGKVVNLDEIDFSTDGENKAVLKGDLTIHGETHEVEVPGVFEIAGDNIEAMAVFTVSLEDYKIKIPKAVTDNIAKEIEITVFAELKKL